MIKAQSQILKILADFKAREVEAIMGGIMDILHLEENALSTPKLGRDDDPVEGKDF